MPVPALGIHRPAVEGDGICAFALDLFLLCLFMRFRLTLPGFDVHQDFDNVLMNEDRTAKKMVPNRRYTDEFKMRFAESVGIKVYQPSPAYP